MAFNKPCLVCGQLSRGSRCETHQAELDAHNQARKDQDIMRTARKKALYTPHYRKQAKVIRDTTLLCHLCGQGARANDPWEADHLDAGNPNSLLAGAHRSCNQRRGNKPLTNYKR